MSGGMNGAIEQARGEMVDRVLSEKQPDLGLRDPGRVGPGNFTPDLSQNRA
jgi:hypothetical protein